MRCPPNAHFHTLFVLSRVAPKMAWCIDCRKSTYIIVTLLFCVASCLVSTCFMSGILPSSNIEERLEALKEKFVCEYEQECDSEGNPRERSRHRLKGKLKNKDISSQCSDSPAVIKHANEVISSTIQRANRQLDQDSPTSSLLSSAKEAFLNPSRFIVQWIRRTSRHVINGGNSFWTTLTNYHSEDSIYTVSSGPDGVYDNGTIIIPEKGLYYVYGRVTFACIEADEKLKRLQMRMIVEKDSESPGTSILEELDEARCRLKGDVGTLNVNGLFRLSKGDKIALQYKLPGNIGISNLNAPFKTLMGVYKTGKK